LTIEKWFSGRKKEGRILSWRMGLKEVERVQKGQEEV
jgi:hypothetical protein